MSQPLPAGVWLNVGSGPLVVPGWVSIDGSWQARFAERPVARLAARVTGRAVGHWPRGIVCRDVRRGLGVAPSSVAVLYSSHLLEHLSRAEALKFVATCVEALAPGGVCRLVTPDLAALADRYRHGRTQDAAAADHFVAATLLGTATDDAARPWLRWYRAHTRFDAHKWLYDGASLAALLVEAGLRSPRLCDYLESDIPAARLSLVEQRDRVADGAGVVVEARR